MGLFPHIFRVGVTRSVSHTRGVVFSLSRFYCSTFLMSLLLLSLSRSLSPLFPSAFDTSSSSSGKGKQPFKLFPPFPSAPNPLFPRKAKWESPRHSSQITIAKFNSFSREKELLVETWGDVSRTANNIFFPWPKPGLCHRHSFISSRRRQHFGRAEDTFPRRRRHFQFPRKREKGFVFRFVAISPPSHPPHYHPFPPPIKKPPLTKRPPPIFPPMTGKREIALPLQTIYKL